MINTPAGFILRPANNTDTVEIKNLIFTILRDYGLSPDPSSTDIDLSDIETHYFKNGGTFEVLIDTTKQSIIGTVGLWRIDDDNVELRKMYLDKNYRGNGLGRYLIEHAIFSACKIGFKHMVLETASVLKEAVALYSRYGFTVCHPHHLAARCDIAMELDLSTISIE